jgi:5-methyltetrahydrofolate--homocysteine methyltransferase
MKQKITNSAFFDRLYHPDRPVIVFDGAMGSNLQLQNLTAADFGGEKYEGCNEYLVCTKPEAVAKVHRDFLAAGADVIETDTFGGTHLTLAEYDLADRTHELNKTAAELAKKVAQEFTTPEKPRFVAGSMGPGTKLPSIGAIDYDTLEEAYAEQARGLLSGGVDLFLVETCMDVLQIKAALNGIETVFAETGRRIPLMVSATFEEMGTMLAGSDISALVTTLEPFSIDILGLNCATGPDLMSPHVKYLCETSPFVVSCIPNAGLPENIGGHAHYKLTPIELKMAVMRFVEDWGVQVIGGCCGTSPEHIRQLAAIAQEVQPIKREPAYEPSAASLMTAQNYFQENSFLIVGERLNASGSKKCRDLLNAEDWDGLVSLARAQVKEGAQVLDVNVDYVGRDGVRDMHEVVSRVVNSVNLPLMLDSTEWEKMEAGLKVAGGKCLLNSTNFEDGDERFFKVLSLAKKYGAGVVIGTIDEDGMARTAEKKFSIAQRAYRAAVEYGIPAREIFFDTLVLPISTGIEEDRVNGRETIEGIRRIREGLPECHILLGVSNVSFGLSPATRQVLNSVFLHDAMAAGMDGAIVTANKILPMAKISVEHQKVCRDLIYDRREFDGDICTYDPLGALTTMFAGVSTKKEKVVDDNEPIESKLKNHIIDGERQGLEDNLTKAMQDHPPLTIINSFLLDGMKVVGELFGSGQMQLPFVLQSAETMKAAVAFLEPHMEKSESGNNGKGTFLIATVKGDVHDIGKNLVDIILSNNGYQVLNIGIKQPVENILEAYRKQPVDCIAMSGLLVKSTNFMKENLEVFNQQGITVPVILGGAALTPKFVYEDCQKVYKGQVIYGKDAFADLNFMDRLMPAKAAEQWNDHEGFQGDFAQYNQRGRVVEEATEAKPEKAAEPMVIDTNRSTDVAVDIDRPTPPFWGTKILGPGDISIEDLFWHLDLQALIAGQWQFRKPQDQSVEEYEAFKAEKVYPILEGWKTKLRNEEWLHPQMVYGYFPCVAEGNSLHVYAPEAVEQGLTPQTAKPFVTWTFPRQRSLRRLCIADFFRPIVENKFDVFPMQAVTMGEIATVKAKVLFDGNNYTEYLYFHGMAVQMAEALAEWGHAKVRRELGYGDLEPDNIRDMLAQRYQGSRYSFGYPACPNVLDQVEQLKLLGVDRLGMYMDESEQLYPEQSTTALMVYHPTAKYFSA